MAVQPAVAQDDDGLAFIGVNVIPMDAERVLENQVVIVENGTIRTVGDVDATSIPTNFATIDGVGRYLMPGLADLHVHLRHQDELVNYVAWGVTTVMHLGGSGQSGLQQLKYRDEIRSGARLGPNIYTTDRILDGDPAIATGAHSIRSRADARHVVRELKADGFDFVKIYNNVSQPVFDAIVEEADLHGLSVIGHLLQRLTLEFHKAGILQVIGTDASLAGLFPGKAAHRELTEFIKAGLSNFEALSIGSRNAGEFVRRYIDEDVRFGQVRPGYRADLVLLDANPLDDIRNTRSIRGVAVNGRYIDRSELDLHRAELRTRYRISAIGSGR